MCLVFKLISLCALDNKGQMHKENKCAGDKGKGNKIHVPAVIEVKNGKIVHRRLAEEQKIGFVLFKNTVHHKGKHRNQGKYLKI